MFTKRSWEGFYDSFIVTGAVLVIFAALFIKNKGGQELPIAVGILILGLVLLAFGVYSRVKRYQETHEDTNYEIDQTKEYIFTMQTSQDHIETVNNYSQIEEAIKNLDKMKQGCVEIRIQPPMGGIKQINVFYWDKDAYAHTYILQERDKGEGYWVCTCDKAIGALNDLKRLYVKHKPIEYRLYHRKETEVR